MKEIIWNIPSCWVDDGKRNGLERFDSTHLRWFSTSPNLDTVVPNESYRALYIIIFILVDIFDFNMGRSGWSRLLSVFRLDFRCGLQVSLLSITIPEYFDLIRNWNRRVVKVKERNIIFFFFYVTQWYSGQFVWIYFYFPFGWPKSDYIQMVL